MTRREGGASPDVCPRVPDTLATPLRCPDHRKSPPTLTCNNHSLSDQVLKLLSRYGHVGIQMLPDMVIPGYNWIWLGMVCSLLSVWQQSLSVMCVVTARHHCLHDWVNEIVTVALCAYCRCLDMLIRVLTSKYHFSSVFYNRMFDEIRQSRDALKPDSKSANMVVILCSTVPVCSTGSVTHDTWSYLQAI